MKILYKKRFWKAYKKLPPKIQGYFCERLELFISDKYNEVLANHSVDPTCPNSRSINITGDYRAIFYEEGEVVTFITMGTHAQLYG